jgi:hypothetical protein
MRSDRAIRVRLFHVGRMEIGENKRNCYGVCIREDVVVRASYTVHVNPVSAPPIRGSLKFIFSKTFYTSSIPSISSMPLAASPYMIPCT